eukprot:TRINITY_DN17286_c0_g1_i2.p1 TRINITY_DN17286_c0_g1~~TRINITY_DN17286_c0_g1_i2.p1  ORF type:complete len:223 (-),score=51.73 TRINITY_DN17286_c0_g1_i2:355-1023(-)
MDDSWDSKVAWDSRYESEKVEEGEENRLAGKIRTFDWHQNYHKLDPLLQQYGVTPGKKVVILGCGNSKLPEDMADNGFNSIIGLDWSEVVIAKMQERCADRTGIEWKTADVVDPESMKQIPDQSQDVVIDKALFDCLMSRPDSTDSVLGMLEQVQRILATGGLYILVTHGDVESRMWYLQNAKLKDWTIQNAQISILELGTEEENAKCSLKHTLFACRSQST